MINEPTCLTLWPYKSPARHHEECLPQKLVEGDLCIFTIKANNPYREYPNPIVLRSRKRNGDVSEMLAEITILTQKQITLQSAMKMDVPYITGEYRVNRVVQTLK